MEPRVTQHATKGHFDLAVVGAGIVGLATALAATRRGLKVVVIDRDVRAKGASVRNFGFVTVSGQERGLMWARARRGCEVWREVSGAAGIPIEQHGMWLIARRAETVALIEAFLKTEMADGCSMLSPAEAHRRWPALATVGLQAVLESTVELRVQSRTAITALAEWLAGSHGVAFHWGTSVHAIESPWVRTTGGSLRAERIVVCPGDEYSTLYGERLRLPALTRCKLQMMRLANPGHRLPATLMSDLGMARYPGYSTLEVAGDLKKRLTAEQPAHVEHGVHLIVVQDADGSLIVGDSHRYAQHPDEIVHAPIETLILDEYRAALGLDPPPTIERWVGTYAYMPDQPVLTDAPEAGVRIVIVTSGAGASIGFALGEELVAELF